MTIVYKPMKEQIEYEAAIYGKKIIRLSACILTNKIFAIQSIIKKGKQIIQVIFTLNFLSRRGIKGKRQKHLIK